MAVVGVRITGIDADRDYDVGDVDGIKRNSNVSLEDITEEDVSFGGEDQEGLRFTFTFDCDYEPDIGHIGIDGFVLFVGDEDEVEDILEGWGDGERPSADILKPVLNAALRECNVQALKASEDLNLPAPFRLPRVEEE